MLGPVSPYTTQCLWGPRASWHNCRAIGLVDICGLGTRGLSDPRGNVILSRRLTDGSAELTPRKEPGTDGRDALRQIRYRESCGEGRWHRVNVSVPANILLLVYPG